MATWVEPWSFDEARRELVTRTKPAIDTYEQFRDRAAASGAVPTPSLTRRSARPPRPPQSRRGLGYDSLYLGRRGCGYDALP